MIERKMRKDQVTAEPKSGWRGEKERKKGCLSTGKARTITRMSRNQDVDMYNRVETMEA